MKPPLPHRREAMSFVLLMTLMLAAVAYTAGKTREPQRLGEYDSRPARHGYVPVGYSATVGRVLLPRRDESGHLHLITRHLTEREFQVSQAKCATDFSPGFGTLLEQD